MVDLSKAYLMDGQHVLSQEHLNVAQEIAWRYENLRLIWIPPADRIPGTDEKPFAVLDIRTQLIIKQFPEKQVPLIPMWLWENDSHRIDTYAKFMKEQEEAKIAREKAIEEAHAPKVELAHSILKSPLHSYKHDGIRYSDSGIEKVD